MKKKILVILLVLVFIYCIGGVVYSIFVRQQDSGKKEEIKKNLITIKDFDYYMDEEVAIPLYKTNFLELKKNLESSQINYEEYVKSVAKLFIIDFYTLDNKINKYDIGGTQFIYKESAENFKLKASDTIYKYIVDNSTNNRQQELPVVSEIFISNVTESKYKIKETEVPSYEVLLNWLYKKDLGYATSAKLILVQDNKYISIVEVNESEVKDNNGES